MRRTTGSTPGAAPSRFPGFDVLGQVRHWDDVTSALVLGRLDPPHKLFFSDAERYAAAALFDQILDQRAEPRVPVLRMVESRLADGSTDGWHYSDMPHDDEAWRRSLRGLDDEAALRHGRTFAQCEWLEQTAMLVRVQEAADGGQTLWHGLPAGHLWSLWTRYACTAFYSHPWAWNEIGFSGPAYPRGYKNARVGGREPWEVADARPADPLGGQA